MIIKVKTLVVYEYGDVHVMKDSFYILNPQFQAGCTAQFVSDLVGKSEDRFSSHDVDQTRH